MKAMPALCVPISLALALGMNSTAISAAGTDQISLEVLNPIASISVQRVVPAPRLTSLDNKRILLYWNRKLHADVAVDEIRNRLQERYRGNEYMIVQGTAWHPEEGFYEEITDWKPDAVISSTAD